MRLYFAVLKLWLRGSWLATIIIFNSTTICNLHFRLHEELNRVRRCVDIIGEITEFCHFTIFIMISINISHNSQKMKKISISFVWNRFRLRIVVFKLSEKVCSAAFEPGTFWRNLSMFCQLSSPKQIWQTFLIKIILLIMTYCLIPTSAQKNKLEFMELQKPSHLFPN